MIWQRRHPRRRQRKCRRAGLSVTGSDSRSRVPGVWALFLAAATVLLSCCLFPPEVCADDEKSLEDDKIEVIREQLRTERSRLDSLTLLKRTELEQLNSIDEQIELNSELLVRLNRRLKVLEGQERELSLESSQLDSLLARRKARLSKSLRSFYLKRHRMPAISLAANDFAHVVGQVVYTRESLESLKRVIGDTEHLLERVDEKSIALENTRREIDSHYREIAVEGKLLQSERAYRDKLMDRIRSEERLYREHLRQLEADAWANDSSGAIVETAGGSSLFESRKGRLPFPVRGQITKSFGTILDRETQTEVISPGIEIRGAAGGEVLAVYDGIVFHRGTLRGYGKVLILDHGSGWYTLYGRLSEYRVAVGQSVRTGEVIGNLDDGGADGQPSLHFEIRQSRKQYDPVEWLKLD